LSSDPIGIDKGRNHLYVYVTNSPINRLDPIGLADVPPELIGEIPKQILEMAIKKTIGGIYAAACASSYCKRRAIPGDVINTLTECQSIFDRLSHPPGHIYGTAAFLSECADECLRITHTDAFKEECQICEKK